MVEKTDVELQQMLHRDADEERFVFTAPLMENESREFLRNTRSLIDHELLVAAVDARKQADSYWEANESAREEGDPDNLSFVGTRVRIINGSLQLEWFRNRTRPELGQGKPKKVFSTYLRKGRGHRYNKALFSKEPEWARVEINNVEDRYELLRKRAALLSSLRKTLREYEHLINECFPRKEPKKPTEAAE
jgi:hypothetical protein